MIKLKTSVRKLPILMYHDVSPTTSKELTISVEKLEKQFAYLAKNGYKSYHFKDLMDLEKLSSKKNVVITFDDGYVSQLDYVLPLLEKYDLKATFFVPLAYLGKTDEWNTATLPIMTAEQLRSLPATRIELGYHSYFHKRYNELSKAEIKEDTELCFRAASENELPFSAVVAYPYGKYPREVSEKKKFIKQLQSNQFVFGTRIGNRVNRFPFKNPFEIQRIDVKGEFTMATFAWKLKIGKLL